MALLLTPMLWYLARQQQHLSQSASEPPLPMFLV